MNPNPDGIKPNKLNSLIGNKNIHKKIVYIR